MLMWRVLRRMRLLRSSPRKGVLQLPGHAAHARPAGIVTAASAGGAALPLDSSRFLLLHARFAARTVRLLSACWPLLHGDTVSWQWWNR